MKQLFQHLNRTIATPLVLWLRRPLIGAVPWMRRLRFYAFFLLLIALSSPFLHSYLDIALTPGQMITHTAMVVVTVAFVILLMEAVIAALLHIACRENWISSGGFLLRAAVAYVLSNLAVGPIHQLLPFTQAILEKHVHAGQTNMSWYCLPVALLIVYIVYQVMRKDYLARQVVELRQINDELETAQRGRREHPERHSDGEEQAHITVRSNGVEMPLHAESILRVQADENYCHVVTNAGHDETPKRYLVRMTLAEALGMLPEHQFLQTHRSHVVNLRYVTKLIRDGHQRELRLTIGDCVPVGRARIGSVQSQIRDFLAADRRPKRTRGAGYQIDKQDRSIEQATS